VSPLAWLPLVTMVISAVYTAADPKISKAFLVSMFTVSLCCLWPTVINTAFGVVNVNKDLINVSKVLRLNWLTHIIKIVLPSSIPMILTGLRLSIGIAWMVLIAAEMLAQNPGLGKFVWDEFQNGSSNSLGRIMAAILVIGFIGFILDFLLMSFIKSSRRSFLFWVSFLSLSLAIVGLFYSSTIIPSVIMIVLYVFSLYAIFKSQSFKVDLLANTINFIYLLAGTIITIMIFLGFFNSLYSPLTISCILVVCIMSFIVGPIYNLLMLKEKVSC